MPEGRILLKSISQSKKLAALKTDGARLCYSWLIPHLDVRGCFSGDPRVIQGQIMTRLSKSIKTIQGYLDDLEVNELIILYEANSDRFLHVPDFIDKQPKLRPEKEAKPRIPLPTPDQLPTKDVLTPTQVKESKVKESKDRYGEFVTLTEKEHQTLIKKHGQLKVEKMIEVLDNYKGSSGKKYQSDYRTILSWVVDKVSQDWKDSLLEVSEKKPLCVKCKKVPAAYEHDEFGWLCRDCWPKGGDK